jgi:hypothetical protein
MYKKYLILVIPLIAFIAVGILSGDVFSLGHFKDKSGIGGTVEDCNYCHEFDVGFYDNPDPGYNLRWVKRTIKVCSVSTGFCESDSDCPPYETCGRTVKFTSFEDTTPPIDGTLADGNTSLLDGPCEVCHTTTLHHRKTTAGDHEHLKGLNCITCHPHFLDDIVNYFEIRFSGTQSHYTHFSDPKGPRLGTDACFTSCHKSTADFKIFYDNQPLKTTIVCDNCHGKTGNYDGVGGLGACSSTSSIICNEDSDCPIGETCVSDPKWVAYGAKYNWEHGVYEPQDPPDIPPWPYALKAGKEDWCAGCHDDGFGSSRIYYPSGGSNYADAPNVMGDNVIYGYNVSGHGVWGDPTIKCADCHDFVAIHTDGDQRTYSASGNNYKDGYRLKVGMSIPRYGEYGDNAFELCTNCHVWADIVGPDSLFRDDSEEDYLHAIHLSTSYAERRCWDSDWGGGICLNPDTQGGIHESCDSAISCTACHNVHGSGMDTNGDNVADAPCPPMIRHGELISTPGSNPPDKVPAFDFHWKDIGGDYTANVIDSEHGELKCATSATWDVSVNNVCWGCHTSTHPGYDRTLGGPADLTITYVWTSDENNVPKYFFNQNDKIRYHVTFTISGGNTYFIKTPAPSSTTNKAKSITGVYWEHLLPSKSASLTAGEYDWWWQNTIPSSASDDSRAQVTITVRMLNKKGGVLLDKDMRGAQFEIE